MVVSHRYDFQRPSIKRTEEGIATMSSNIVSVDEESLKSDLRELVRKTVQETLNALLDEEADEMVGAERYERTAGREAYRSGHYRRKLVTTSGEVHHLYPQPHFVRHHVDIREDESGIIWNDEDIAINWPLDDIDEIILSEKDKRWKTLKESQIKY